jgi:hypothetical protein
MYRCIQEIQTSEKFCLHMKGFKSYEYIPMLTGSREEENDATKNPLPWNEAGWSMLTNSCNAWWQGKPSSHISVFDILWGRPVSVKSMHCQLLLQVSTPPLHHPTHAVKPTSEKELQCQRGRLLVYMGNLVFSLPGPHWTLLTFRCRFIIQSHCAGQYHRFIASIYSLPIGDALRASSMHHSKAHGKLNHNFWLTQN